MSTSLCPTLKTHTLTIHKNRHLPIMGCDKWSNRTCSQKCQRELKSTLKFKISRLQDVGMSFTKHIDEIHSIIVTTSQKELQEAKDIHNILIACINQQDAQEEPRNESFDPLEPDDIFM